MGRVTDAARIRTVRVREGRLYAGRKGDHVAVEEPLDIRLNGQQLSLTMRTPGHDVELIHGFLHAEGLIRCARVVDETLAAVGGPTLDGAGRRIDTAHVEVRNLAEIARVLVAAALARTESRGTHARSDFVATDPSQARRLVVGTLAP